LGRGNRSRRMSDNWRGDSWKLRIGRPSALHESCITIDGVCSAKVVTMKAQSESKIELNPEQAARASCRCSCFGEGSPGQNWRASSPSRGHSESGNDPEHSRGENRRYALAVLGSIHGNRIPPADGLIVGTLLPSFQKFDLLPDRCHALIYELGIRFKIQRQLRRDGFQLLGVPVQLVSISIKCFNNRF
jgi:hypothetical protein